MIDKTKLEYLSVRMNFDDTVTTCVKRPLEIDKTKILMTNGSLMEVESITECSPLEHSAILLTCIKR